MDLNRSTVHRNLDAKLKIFGFEIFDLLAVLIFASIMNLIFGRSSLSFIMVFLLPALTAAVLLIGKKNKPDQFLIHLLRFFVLPGAFPPGSTPSNLDKMCKRIYYEL